MVIIKLMLLAQQPCPMLTEWSDTFLHSSEDVSAQKSPQTAAVSQEMNSSSGRWRTCLAEYILWCIYLWWNRILHSGEARLLLAGISTTAATRREFSWRSGAWGLPRENNVTNKKHVTGVSPLGWNHDGELTSLCGVRSFSLDYYEHTLTPFRAKTSLIQLI